MKDEKENAPAGEFLCDRAQKITEALYRVTNLLADKEPLKWQLRDNAIKFLDFLMFSEDQELMGAENIFYSIRKISRLLQLAYSSSAFVSSINFEVLRREYLSLSDSFENQLKRQKEEINSNGHSLTSGFDSNGQHLLSNGHNGQSDKNEIVQEKKPNLKADININDKKDIQENNKNADVQKDSVVVLSAPTETQPIILKERKRRILDLIKEGEWVSIREISTSLPGFSSKSIQRDLLEMVNSGILKKVGDKRWRKYSFV